MTSEPVVLVTGASRGLGRGIARTCARIGCHVAIHYQSNETAAQETRQLCESEAANGRQKFLFVKGNVAVSADRKRIFEEILSGLEGLDALVNNAGMAPRIRKDIAEASEESYDEVMDVNLKGAYFLSQQAAQHWLRHPGQGRLPG